MAEETLDHNTALHQLIETGDEQEVAMILGHKDRLRCGGVIRTGVKVPKSTCTDAEKKRFLELEAQGLGYDQIDRELGGEPKTAKSKLYPKNSDFFVVRDCDFTRPADAQLIREKYADKNDSKVRRFPAWFSVGEIDRIVPHGFRAFNGAGNLVAASFYEGKDLKVRYLPKDHKGPAKKDDWKVAPFDPENGKSPAGHKMDFGGFYRFNVPGLRGFDEIVIPTRSWYGMSYTVALLRRVRSVLGRFDGLLNGQPFFELVKSPEEVRAPDGKKQMQFIPVLELSIDPLELARYAESSPARGRAAIAMFNGSPSRPAPKEEAPVEQEEARDTAQEESDPFGEEDPARSKAMEYLHGAIKWSGVTWEAFESYVQHDYPKPIAEMSLEELRALCTEVKDRIKTKDGKDEFAAYVNDIHRGIGKTDPATGGELPFA